MSRGEYRASLRGETVKGSLMRTINEAMRNCNSKDEFTKVKEKDTGWEFTHRQEERTINNVSEEGQILLNLAKSVSKMTEDDEEEEELQSFMILTAVGVTVAIELAKRLMEIPKDELNDDMIYATVEEHQEMQAEMDEEDMYEDQGLGGMSM